MRTTFALLDEPGAFHQGAEVVQRDASIYLEKRSLDDVLELRRIESAGAGQREQMPPRFGSEPPAFMRAQYAKRHEFFH